MKSELCIIGAGITGIMLAKKFPDSIIVEKSRAVGGRLAARRLGSYYLNHGPEEFRNPINGITVTDPHGWVKKEAEVLTIEQSWEVSHLELLPDKIKVVSNQGLQIESRKIILTVPAPQAQLILQRSNLPADFLAPVVYKRVIQFILLSDSSSNNKVFDDYVVRKRVESLHGNLFIGLYEIKDPFLEEFFDKDKEEIKNILRSLITANVLDCHVHKWRYSEVVSSIAPKFQTIFKDKNIFLAGDYFGIHGVDSSMESVQNITSFL